MVAPTGRGVGRPMDRRRATIGGSAECGRQTGAARVGQSFRARARVKPRKLDAILAWDIKQNNLLMQPHAHSSNCCLLFVRFS